MEAEKYIESGRYRAKIIKCVPPCLVHKVCWHSKRLATIVSTDRRFSAGFLRLSNIVGKRSCRCGSSCCGVCWGDLLCAEQSTSALVLAQPPEARRSGCLSQLRFSVLVGSNSYQLWVHLLSLPLVRQLILACSLCAWSIHQSDGSRRSPPTREYWG